MLWPQTNPAFLSLRNFKTTKSRQPWKPKTAPKEIPSPTSLNNTMALRSIVDFVESLLARGFAQIGLGECQAIQAGLQLYQLSANFFSVVYVSLLQPGFIARCGRSLQGTKAPFRSRPRTSGSTQKPTSPWQTLGIIKRAKRRRER